MNSIEEIKHLENQLREAELGPDPIFFKQVLAENVILDGEMNKVKVVAAHEPGKGPKFTKVHMSQFQFVDHGNTVVVTCKGEYESAQWSGTLDFMRVWHKKDDRWQIIAGSVSNA